MIIIIMRHPFVQISDMYYIQHKLLLIIILLIEKFTEIIELDIDFIEHNVLGSHYL